MSAAADIGAPRERERPGRERPASDLAWYNRRAGTLPATRSSPIAPGPDPTITAVNPTTAEILSCWRPGAAATSRSWFRRRRGEHAGSEPGAAYLLRDAAGLYAAVSYAADDRMAGYPISSARPVSGSILIRP